MAYTKIDPYKGKSLERRIEGFKKFSPSPQESKHVLEFLRLLSIGEITGKPVGEARRIKLLDMFIILFRNIKKPSSQITIEDLRKLKEDLLKDKIKKVNGQPYSDTTKEDVSESIVRYLEWKHEDKAIKWKLRKWFIVKSQKKTPEYLTEAEIERLLDHCKNIDEKFLISVLFDSGARIGEFLNIRFEDIIKPTENFPYYKIDLKEEYSKTEGRIIGLYWKNSTRIVSEYLSSVEIKDQKEQIFKKDYDTVRFILRSLGKRALNKQIHPHLFRKSSATYYASTSQLNRSQFYKRYGWKFSSDMGDVYINRTGIEEDDVKKMMLNTDLTKITKENTELKTQMAMMKDKLNALSEMVERDYDTADQKGFQITIPSEYEAEFRPQIEKTLAQLNKVFKGKKFEDLKASRQKRIQEEEQ